MPEYGYLKKFDIHITRFAPRREKMMVRKERE